MDEHEQDLRALQIIGVALISGPAAFLLVVIFLTSDPERDLVEDPGRMVVTWLALAMCVAVLAASLLLPRPKGGDRLKIRGHFLMKLALVEGGALLAGVAYLTEREVVSFGLAVFCIAAMAVLHFPTRERVERLLADRG
jgi:hypothetical protein